MPMTRRDALKLAAADGTAHAAPFAVDPAEAAALLDLPAAAFAPDHRRSPIDGPDTGSVVDFAEMIDGLDFRSLFELGAAEEMAVYKQALDRLLDAHPELREGRGDRLGDRLVTALDEAALSLWVAAWMGGVRAGAAYEHLRLAMVTTRQVCARCHGHGRTWGGRPFRYRDDSITEEACPDCGGRGTMPTPAPTLGLAAGAVAS